MPRTFAALTAVAVGLLALAAPAAIAKPAKRPDRLVVAPARPKATDELTFRFRVPAGVETKERYAVQLLVPKNGLCQPEGFAAARRAVFSGSRVTVSMTPNASGRYAGWCAGDATATLMRLDTIDDASDPLHVVRFWNPVSGSRSHIKIRRAPGFHPGPFGTDVGIELLPGSTATVTAPSRADRILGLRGSVAGFIAGRFSLNSDYAINLGPGVNARHPPVAANALSVSSLVTDPSCSSGTLQPFAPVANAPGSKLTFARDGSVTGTLVLAVDATSLAGCAGPATGTTTLTLTGTLGIKKLADALLTATITGVPVGGGVLATVDIALHLTVNIFDGP